MKPCVSMNILLIYFLLALFAKATSLTIEDDDTDGSIGDVDSTLRRIEGDGIGRNNIELRTCTTLFKLKNWHHRIFLIIKDSIMFYIH